MRISLALLWLTVALTWPVSAMADSGFRCKSGRLVSVGDRMGDVHNRCGDPDTTSTRVEKRKVKRRYTRWVGNVQETVVEEVEVEVPLDEWTYDLGANAFIRYVLFENGRVIEIATGGYGRP